MGQEKKEGPVSVKLEAKRRPNALHKPRKPKDLTLANQSHITPSDTFLTRSKWI
jgi:hypothetical protein